MQKQDVVAEAEAALVEAEVQVRACLKVKANRTVALALNAQVQD
jgi:hypothetical protein